MVLQTFATLVRQILKLITRKESLQLWMKLHSLFQLKLEVKETQKNIIQVEPLQVSDIQDQLFKLDTFYMRETAAIEYAMSKLDAQKKEALAQFDQLKNETANIQENNEWLDNSLQQTNAKINQNIESLNTARDTFENEMQERFQKLVEAQKKLNFRKQKLLEDLDF